MNIKEIEEARTKWWRVQGNNPTKMIKWQGFIVGHVVNFLLNKLKDLEAENKRLRGDKTNLVMSSLNLFTAIGKAESEDDINHPVLKLCKKHMQETLDDTLSKDKT